MLSDQRCQVLTFPPAVIAAAAAAAASSEVSLYRGVQGVREEVGRGRREEWAV